MQHTREWIVRCSWLAAVLTLGCAIFGSLWSGLYALGDTSGARFCKGVFWGLVGVLGLQRDDLDWLAHHASDEVAFRHGRKPIQARDGTPMKSSGRLPQPKDLSTHRTDQCGRQGHQRISPRITRMVADKDQHN